MNLQEKFNIEPPNKYLIEIMDGSTPTGIYYIPILYVKEMLSQDFLSWEVEAIQIKEFMWGQSCMINCSLILVLKSSYFEQGCYDKLMIFENKYPGGFTFNISRYKNNEDWAAIGISECIKNAAKNIGRKYGMYLNQGRIDAQALEGITSLTAPLKTPPNPTTKKAIHSITKLNK